VVDYAKHADLKRESFSISKALELEKIAVAKPDLRK
jgi:hypothetical protein